ncbi:MAG: Rid family hydrolase [Defluviitaleaceae bacterium]|nr:Rid family hydrolase [Defluviitaleaceae bacterium]
MSNIVRKEVHKENANSSVIEAGGFVFIGHCCRNQGQSLENQIIGALDQLNERLSLTGLTLESVVQIDALFRDVHQIPVMEKVFKERFNGKYPARKSIQTEFADESIDFQLDAVAVKE